MIMLSRLFSRFTRAGFCASLTLVPLLALNDPALAQVKIPAHSIEKTSNGKSCKVTLVPTMTSGDQSPVITFTSDDKSRFGISANPGEGAVALELVVNNGRQEFVQQKPQIYSKIKNSSVWKAIEETDKKDAPFFLTARYVDGSYGSARYQGVDPKGILEIFKTQCSLNSSATPPKTKSELLAEENRVKTRLSSDQMRHIIWVLNSTYGNRYREPSNSTSLTETDRGYLERYSRSTGYKPSRYLNQVLANRLLAERFVAATPKPTSSSRLATYRDWRGYMGKSNECHITSAATSWRGLSLYLKPEFLIYAKTGEKGGYLWFNMVRPDPFLTTSPVWAIVDGRRYNLQHLESGYIMPAKSKSGKGLDGSVIRAIKRGRGFEIHGTDPRTKRRASITFSAYGFSKAFDKMMRDCNRYDLKVWLR